MIRAEDLRFRYSPLEAPVLGPITLDIQPGEYVGIIGPNGCGKTTLVKHFNALLLPTEGRVRVDHLDTADRSHWAEIRRRVGMVFQNPDHQIVAMTVEEDVAFGPGNLGLCPAEIKSRVARSLEAVGMASFADRPPHTLSGGERRLAAIAGILALNPGYIIFDEPTSDLDRLGRERVLQIMGKLNRQGMAVIHITHHMDEIAGAHRLVVMENGRVAFQGTPREVFGRVEWLKGLHLDVPRITELMWRLGQMKANIRPDILTVEEACAEIIAWRENERPAADAEKGIEGR